jgi:hypothetical protein
VTHLPNKGYALSQASFGAGDQPDFTSGFSLRIGVRPTSHCPTIGIDHRMDLAGQHAA